ncbi:hypothetical protein [Actinoallomurus soli]|uniref:hypothetical protein n=1 Tax=Actinoallomurus soli TaxID=2952535 RepID=UPI002093F56B|nr:hypothetical protein [Actinoallomurus soli]MCO5968644.1 hypothetical protein [Actinoallomurus soli]
MRRALLLVVSVVATLVLPLLAPGSAVTASASTGRPADVAAQTVTVRYGPYTIPGAAFGKPGDLPTFGAAPKPCAACDIVGEKPDLVYADGTSANMDTGPMLHHFVIGNNSAHDLVCPADPDRLWASGNERTDKELPEGYGVPVHVTDNWGIITELMNYSSAPKTVYVSIDYRIVPAGSTTPVRSIWMDAGGCLTSDYAIPAGKSVHSWGWTSTVSGRLVFANGHQHDGGVHVSLTDDGATVCDSNAEYTEMGGMSTIMSMGVCTGDPLATVHAGDRLAVNSYYDSPTAQLNVMGIIHAYIAL